MLQERNISSSACPLQLLLSKAKRLPPKNIDYFRRLQFLAAKASGQKPTSQ